MVSIYAQILDGEIGYEGGGSSRFQEVKVLCTVLDPLVHDAPTVQ